MFSLKKKHPQPAASDPLDTLTISPQELAEDKAKEKAQAVRDEKGKPIPVTWPVNE